MKYIVERAGILLEILKKISPDSSKNTLRSWVQEGRVNLNKKIVDRANTPVNVGEEIVVGPKSAFLKGSLRILYKDDRLVVLEKPEGLLSVATEKENNWTVHSILKKQFHNPRIYPVHRLDRETSGVMIFVYDKEAQNHLKSQFERQSVEKTYYAIVQGQMPIGEGIWESYMQEDDFLYVRSTNDSVQGKRAITHYQVLKAQKNYSFLCLKPKTGRKNQLRVHCRESGFPIVGDKKYGQGGREKRLYLHAQKICFEHPSHKKRLCFDARLPASFYKVFNISDLESSLFCL